ncbi:MAG: Spy/CpxP family protein refolding chaperone [Acidobacteriaceae bacterium]|nr:Spy/CpxP family protein refolding chaperone [Acidobacteriaceae bacterium]
MQTKLWSRLGVAVMGAGLLAAALPSRAQDQSAPPPPPPAADGQGPAHGRMAHMYDSLNLTPEQKESFKQAARAQREKMQALRDDNAMAPEDKREQMKKIRRDTVEQMRSVLTDDQKPQFDEIQKQMREHMRERMKQGGDGEMPPPPPPSN